MDKRRGGNKGRGRDRRFRGQKEGREETRMGETGRGEEIRRREGTGEAGLVEGKSHPVIIFKS